jgi:hypothetical protein
MESEMKRFYFHCSDGLDLVLDREGIEADGSEVLWWALKAADRLISALPTYDGFCGAPTSGCSWCARHRGIVYRNQPSQVVL